MYFSWFFCVLGIVIFGLVVFHLLHYVVLTVISTTKEHPAGIGMIPSPVGCYLKVFIDFLLPDGYQASP